jgi:hypothetical protein
MELTDEQKAFLAECEEEFANRYTEKDEEFLKVKLQKPSKPPIIDPWYNIPRRSNNWSRHNESRGNGYRNLKSRIDDEYRVIKKGKYRKDEDVPQV